MELAARSADRGEPGWTLGPDALEPLAAAVNAAQRASLAPHPSFHQATSEVGPDTARLEGLLAAVPQADGAPTLDPPGPGSFASRLPVVGADGRSPLVVHLGAPSGEEQAGARVAEFFRSSAPWAFVEFAVRLALQLLAHSHEAAAHAQKSTAALCAHIEAWAAATLVDAQESPYLQELLEAARVCAERPAQLSAAMLDVAVRTCNEIRLGAVQAFLKGDTGDPRTVIKAWTKEVPFSPAADALVAAAREAEAAEAKKREAANDKAMTAALAAIAGWGRKSGGPGSSAGPSKWPAKKKTKPRSEASPSRKRERSPSGKKGSSSKSDNKAQKDERYPQSAVATVAPELRAAAPPSLDSP